MTKRGQRNALHCTLLLLLLLTSMLNGCMQDKSTNDQYEHALRTAGDLLDKNRKREAICYLDSAYASLPKATPYYLFRKYYFKKLFYYYQHKYDSNNLYVDSMIYVLEANHLTRKYRAEYAMALNAKGDYYFDNNNLNDAFDLYYRSKMASQDTCAFANQTYHLGMIFYRQKKYKDAIQYFKQALAENAHCGNDSIPFYKKEELYNNIALSFTQVNSFDSARLYYNYALNFARNDSKRFGSTVKRFAEVAEGVIDGNLAKIYISQNSNDTAEQLLQKSIAINIRPGYDNTDALYALTQLAELYNKTGRYAQAMPLLKQISAGLDSVSNKEIRLRWQYLMFEYYSKIGRPNEAFPYVEGYVSLRDSLDVSNKRLGSLDISQLLHNQETLYQLKLLKKDNQLNRLYLAITVGLSLVTLAVILTVYLSYRRSRRNVRTLVSLNQHINKQNAQLEATMQQLQMSNRDKDRILHIVAHDLRDPISGIIALSDIILEEEENESNRESLALIKNTSRNSLTLINELLDYTGDAKRDETSRKEAYDLNEKAKKVIALLQFRANAKDQTLRLAPSADPLPVLVYKEKFMRVLTNIISNAVKFSPQGAEILITLYKKDDLGVVEVKDSGIGIPENLHPHLFESFTSAKRNGTFGERSLGLGLSICKQILEELGGKIRFASTPGVGSTFFIEVPLHKS